MREISPAENMEVEEFLNAVPHNLREKVEKIREEKLANKRPVPSTNFIDRSNYLSADTRQKLIDKVALLVDENLVGRSEMCIQFALLLNRALEYLGISSKVFMGKAMYFESGTEIFRWDHTWVRIADEVIDCNVDILYENPTVPEKVKVKPYWGPVKMTPRDRRLREDRNISIPSDTDVDDIWWPELKGYIDSEINK